MKYLIIVSLSIGIIQYAQSQSYGNTTSKTLNNSRFCKVEGAKHNITVRDYGLINAADNYCKTEVLMDNDFTKKTCTAFTTTKRKNNGDISVTYNCQLEIKCKYKKPNEGRDDYLARCRKTLGN